MTNFQPRNPCVASTDRRIHGLDGLRGVACLAVVVSHFFGEVPHGLRPAMVGWVAVDIFFVLSGFLIGRLILDKSKYSNFFVTFYARRACRLLPAYLVTLATILILLEILPPYWSDADQRFPAGAYIAFLQGGWMVATNSIGPHWLAPTWTLAVEEHFYLLVPALIVFTPRRALAPALVLVGLAAILIRWAAAFGGPEMAMAALVMLPGRADLLTWGLLAALLNASDAVDWSKAMPVMRIAPIAGLLLAAAASLVNETLFGVVGPTLVGFSCAALILCIVHGAPEAERFTSPILRFFGDNGYCLYLSHLVVLGLAHGLILGKRPDLQTPAQWGVTMLALPLCILVAWLMTKFIENPFMALGRRWQWGAERETGFALAPATREWLAANSHRCRPVPVPAVTEIPAIRD